MLTNLKEDFPSGTKNKNTTMEQYEINFRGENFLVQGDYEKAEKGRYSTSDGSPGTPDTPHSFLITKVMLDDGTDVTEELKAEDFSILQEKILEQYYDEPF